MAETRQTPLQIFEAGEATLQSNITAYKDALDIQTALEAKLRSAERTTDRARTTAENYGATVLKSIHDSVTAETDPGEYLQAVLNTHYSGQRVGDAAVERLAPLRAAMQDRSIPLAIVGSTIGEVRIGFSAGDIQVRRRKKHEGEFDTAAGVRLALPMIRTTGYETAGFGYSEYQWTYDGNITDIRNIGVRQSLGKLRIAGNEASVQAFNDTPHAPFSQYDTVTHHERDVKDQTGFVPMVAYGEAAVTALLAAFYRKRNVPEYRDAPSADTVLAAAVSLDIDPVTVADISGDEIKERLSAGFLAHVTGAVIRVISNEANKRQFPNSSPHFNPWPITASPQVMEYASVAPADVVGAMQQGIESSIGPVEKLRADHPDDKDSWVTPNEKEYRLTETEAQTLAVGIVAARYGLAFEPAQLHTETIRQKLDAQLEEKRRQKRALENARFERGIYR